MCEFVFVYLCICVFVFVFVCANLYLCICVFVYLYLFKQCRHLHTYFRIISIPSTTPIHCSRSSRTVWKLFFLYNLNHKGICLFEFFRPSRLEQLLFNPAWWPRSCFKQCNDVHTSIRTPSISPRTYITLWHEVLKAIGCRERNFNLLAV